MTKGKRKLKKGFTLIELLVVIGIIALLTSVLAVTVSGIFDLGNQTKCLAKVKGIARAFQGFARAHHNTLPGGTYQQGQGPADWQGPWIGSEVGFPISNSYRTNKHGTLLRFMEVDIDSSELKDTYRCPTLEFIQRGCYKGSNGAFDYASPNCFYGASITKIRNTSKFKDETAGEYITIATPLLLEEDPEKYLNSSDNLEPGHCNRDELAMTHGKGSNIAGVDGSAHRFRTTHTRGPRAGYDWQVKTPRGRTVTFDVNQHARWTAGNYGKWNDQ